MISSLLGTNPFGSIANSQAPQSQNLTALNNLAAQQFNQAYSNYQAQAAAQYSQSQYSAMQSLLMQANKKKFMLNGVPMTFTEFLDEIAPGEDNSLRTFLTLKYQGIE